MTLFSINPPLVMTGESSLLRIPREIRDQILKLVLLEGNIFYPYGYGPSTGEESSRTRKAPQISILSVNKQMSLEGNAIL